MTYNIKKSDVIKKIYSKFAYQYFKPINHEKLIFKV